MSATEEEVKARFRKICLKADSLGLTGGDLANLEIVRKLRTSGKRPIKKCVFSTLYWLTLGSMFLTILLATQWPLSREAWLQLVFQVSANDLTKEPCILPLPESVADYVRPPIDCGVCKGVNSVDRVEKLNSETFEVKYAYSGVPVVVTDGAKNWSATTAFSFEFFKSIYADDSPVLQHSENHCQFFPYKTSFGSLAEVFNMSEDRINFKEGSEPWYIGW